MRYPSDLLFALARSLGGRLDGNEGELEIGTDVVPVITIPVPLKTTSVIVVTEEQNQSFSLEDLRSLAASAARSEAEIAILGPGLWDVRLFCRYSADFTGTVGQEGGIVGLKTVAAGTTVEILHFQPIANLSQHAWIEFRILVDERGLGIRNIQGATGVGQTSAMFIGGILTKLT